MSDTGLWTRIGSWLKTSRSRPGPGRPSGSPLVPTDQLSGDGFEGERDDRGSLSRWSRRDQTLQKLQEGFERLSDVLDGVRAHLDEHAERSKAMTTSLQQLVELTRQLPQQSAEQSATLERIAGAIARSAEREERLASNLADLPALQRRQIEAVTAIDKRLVAAGESDAALAAAVERVGGAVDRWASSVDEQSETTNAIRAAIQQNDDALRSLLNRQHRTWTWLLVMVLVVATAALAVGTLALVL